MDPTPLYYYLPQESAEHESLSSGRGTSVVSAGLLVDTNLETSIPDSYRAPPAPLPYDVDSHTVVEADGRFGGSAISEAFEKSDCKIKSDSLIDPSSLSDEPSKLKDETVSPAIDEEDVCPTCLEEYDLENPRIITKCEHHFHMSCILEWMERSDTCPICDQVMVIDYTSKA